MLSLYVLTYLRRTPPDPLRGRTPPPLRGTSSGLRMIGVLNILYGWFTSVWKEVVFLQKFLKDEGKT